MIANKQLILLDNLSTLEKQKSILNSLKEMEKLIQQKEQVAIITNEEYIYALMFTMQENAFIREKQEKYDSATLLLYRLLEMIEQRRLSRYNINVAHANFLNIQFDSKKTPEYKKLSAEDRLTKYKQEMYDIKLKVFGKCSSSYLSEQISLLEGFLHLTALKDELMTFNKIDPIAKCKKLRSVVYLRNNSIFAHGYSLVGYRL